LTIQIPKREGKELRFADLSPIITEENQMIVEGRAVVFNQPTVLFTSGGIEYKEVIEAGALDEADMRDVVFRYNHNDNLFIMARTRGGSLEVTKEGLVRAKFFDTQQARDLYTLIKAGAVDKMSFAFTIREESFDKETRTWHVRKIDKVFDVAAVDQPAYDATSISARKVLDLERERMAALERAQELESFNARKRALLLKTLTY
jgi:HK97 family phage prohead protease